MNGYKLGLKVFKPGLKIFKHINTKYLEIVGVGSVSGW